MMKSPKFKIYGIKRTPKRIKVVRKEIQGNKRQSWPKSSIKFNSLMYLKQELAEDLNHSFSTLPTQDFNQKVSTLPNLDFNQTFSTLPTQDSNQKVSTLERWGATQDLNQSFSMKPTQIFEELNETISSLSLNESKDSEMVGNLNQNDFVENQETKGFENVTIKSASTSGSHQSQINMDSTKIEQLQSLLPGQKQDT